MAKELKDYLHLYFGAEYKITWIANGRNPSHRKLTRVSASNIYRVLQCLVEPKYFSVSLYLRPLSDMTGDELIQYGKIEFPDMKGSFDLKGIREVAMHAYYEPETFKWLLSKHFDLFGLIDAGLAIDKTTLK